MSAADCRVTSGFRAGVGGAVFDTREGGLVLGKADASCLGTTGIIVGVGTFGVTENDAGWGLLAAKRELREPVL